MAEQISDAKIKATEKEHSESFDSIFVNDGDKVRQVTKEKARELMGVTGAETAIEKLGEDSTETKRKIDFLWKLNQGISYQYETDSASAYQKDIPSGAKCATVNKVGGKTVVWNQLANLNGTTSYSKEYSLEPLKFTGTIFSIETISGHKYLYVLGKETADKLRPAIGGNFPFVNDSTLGTRYSTIITGTGVTSVLSLKNDNETDEISGTVYFNLIDLTIMFGSGNEPSTVAEFEAMFPADYYDYNAGTLMSAQVNEVVEQGKNLWDEEWEAGNINTSNGQNDGNSAYIRSKGYIPASRVAYTIVSPTSGELCFYNSNKEYLTHWSFNSGSTVRDLSSTESLKNVAYMRFYALKNSDYKIAIVEGTSGEYSPYHKTTYTIPQSIIDLDGYGWGITDEVCNYVDWENKTYHKKCYKLVLTGSEAWSADATAGGHRHNLHRSNANFPEPANGTGYGKKSLCNIATYYSSGNNAPFGNFYISQNWLVFCDNDDKYADVDAWKSYLSSMYSNGTPVTIIYELADEVVTDISDLVGDTFQNPFEVEAGGTLTFKNSNGDDYRIPVPNEEEYLIALAEVTA